MRSTSPSACSFSDVVFCLPVLHNAQEIAEQHDYGHLADSRNIDRSLLFDLRAEILKVLCQRLRNTKS